MASGAYNSAALPSVLAATLLASRLRFVRFANKRCALRALDEKNIVLDGREVEIKPATARGSDSGGHRSPPSASGSRSPSKAARRAGRGKRQGGASGGRGDGPDVQSASGHVAPLDASVHSVRKIFAGGLHYSTDEERLREYFAQFGEVASAQVLYNRETRKSRGFGFVIFASAASMPGVLAQAMHNIDGKMVEVKAAVPKGSPALALPKPAPEPAPSAAPSSAPEALSQSKAIPSGLPPKPAPAPRGDNTAPTPAPAPAPASWAAVLAGTDSSKASANHAVDSAHAATLFSGADSVTASVVSSVLDEAAEAVPDAGEVPAEAVAPSSSGGMTRGTIPEDATVATTMGLPPLGLQLSSGSDLWGPSGLALGAATPVGADSLSVHSMESGLGSASVMSATSALPFSRPRADSQVSQRSEAASVTQSLPGTLGTGGGPQADVPGAPHTPWSEGGSTPTVSSAVYGQFQPQPGLGGAPPMYGGFPAGLGGGWGQPPPSSMPQAQPAGTPLAPGSQMMQAQGMPFMPMQGQPWMAGGFQPTPAGGIAMQPGMWGMPLPMQPVPQMPPPPALPNVNQSSTPPPQ